MLRNVNLNNIFLVCNQSLEIQKDNGMAAMLDDKTKRSVIQHGCHTIVFWISRDWLQTKNSNWDEILKIMLDGVKRLFFFSWAFFPMFSFKSIILY